MQRGNTVVEIAVRSDGTRTVHFQFMDGPYGRPRSIRPYIGEHFMRRLIALVIVAAFAIPTMASARHHHHHHHHHMMMRH